MRLLRALTLMLLMLNIVPTSAMHADRGGDVYQQGGIEHCGHASAMHHHRGSCGRPSAATCCAGVQCAWFGADAIEVDAADVCTSLHGTPAGPEMQPLVRTSAPDTPPPRA